MKKAGVTNRMLARVIGKNEGAVSRKLNGHSDFTIDEACRIRDAFFRDASIDTLFDRAG